MCGKCNESISHLLFNCKVFNQVYSKYYKWYRMRKVQLWFGISNLSLLLMLELSILSIISLIKSFGSDSLHY